MQRAIRSMSAAPCTCGQQPMHVHHFAGNQHSFECPPCGITTGKFGTQALALMKWRQITTGIEQPASLRSVRAA